MKAPVLESLFNKIAGLIFRVIGRDQWHKLDFLELLLKKQYLLRNPVAFAVVYILI